MHTREHLHTKLNKPVAWAEENWESLLSTDTCLGDIHKAHNFYYESKSDADLAWWQKALDRALVYIHQKEDKYYRYSGDPERKTLTHKQQHRKEEIKFKIAQYDKLRDEITVKKTAYDRSDTAEARTHLNEWGASIQRLEEFLQREDHHAIFDPVQLSLEQDDYSKSKKAFNSPSAWLKWCCMFCVRGPVPRPQVQSQNRESLLNSP
jgi:hypothetical protein